MLNWLIDLLNMLMAFVFLIAFAGVFLISLALAATLILYAVYKSKRDELKKALIIQIVILGATLLAGLICSLIINFIV